MSLVQFYQQHCANPQLYNALGYLQLLFDLLEDPWTLYTATNDEIRSILDLFRLHRFSTFGCVGKPKTERRSNVVNQLFDWYDYLYDTWFTLHLDFIPLLSKQAFFVAFEHYYSPSFVLAPDIQEASSILTSLHHCTRVQSTANKSC
jgi:hypothetical protein